MTGDNEGISVEAIEMCRSLNRKLADQCASRGITVEDVSVASLFATFDIAQRRFGGDPFAAIEFLRTGADLMERQLLAAAR
jgi:hypothetical protein